MAAVSRGKLFGADLTAQLVAAASAVLSQLPEQRLSVCEARKQSGAVSFFTQEPTIVVDALCDALRRAHATASDRVQRKSPEASMPCIYKIRGCHMHRHPLAGFCTVNRQVPR